MRELKLFDVSSYLTSDAIIEEFLIICREDADPKVYLLGMKEVEKALAARSAADSSSQTQEALPDVQSEDSNSPDQRPNFD